MVYIIKFTLSYKCYHSVNGEKFRLRKNCGERRGGEKRQGGLLWQTALLGRGGKTIPGPPALPAKGRPRRPMASSSRPWERG